MKSPDVELAANGAAAATAAAPASAEDSSSEKSPLIKSATTKSSLLKAGFASVPAAVKPANGSTNVTAANGSIEGVVQRRPKMSKRASLSMVSEGEEHHHTGFESLCVNEAQSAAKITAKYTRIKEDHENGTHNENTHASSRWVVNALIGFICGLTSFFLKETVALLFRIRTGLIFSVLDDASGEGSEEPWVLKAWLIAVGFASVLVILSSSIILFWEPKAAGSGIPETCAFLNGVIIPRTFSMRVVFAKFASCALAVGSGIPAGPEGPMIHMGSILGSLVSQGSLFPDKLKERIIHFRNISDRRDFMAAGVAGGVAAAFGAPIGGLLFVAEEIASHWDVNMGMQIFLCSVCACVTVEVLTSAFTGFEFSGTFGMIKDNSAILFDVNKQINVNILMFIPTVVLGAIGGLLGALFNKICLRATDFRTKCIKPHRLLFLLEPIGVAFLYCSFVMYVPTLFECERSDCNGTSEAGCERVGQALVDSTAHGATMAFGCPAGSYNPSASLMVPSGEHVIKQLFARGYHYQFDYLPLLFMLAIYLPTSAYTNGVSCSTGIVVPCLLNGALLGRMFGLLVTDIAGGAPDPSELSREWIDPGAFALIGVAAFFGGVARITMALTVIITEISNDTHFILPVMASIMVGKWVADYTGVPPIYHALMEKKGLPYIHAEPHSELPMDVFVAGQVATPDVITFPVKNRIPHIAKILLEYEHNAFPVIQPAANGSPGGVFLGIARREHLIGLLNSPGLWTNTESKGKNLWHKFRSKVIKKMQSDKLVELEMKAFDAPEELSSASVDKDLRRLRDTPTYAKYQVDLKPYIDRGAFVVQETFSLKTTYTMFRSMGLRHVVVVDALNSVVGMITRHNLVNANLEKLLVFENLKTPDQVLELSKAGSDSDA